MEDVEFEALLQGGSFLEKFAKTSSLEEAQELFMERGISISADQVKTISEQILRDGNELSDDDLNEVSGGIRITPTIPTIPTVANKNVIQTVLKYWYSKLFGR